VHIGAVWKALGPARSKALPAFHAFTGVDNTGRFSRVGKATWLQSYLRTDEDVINALQMLEEAEVTDGLLSTLAGFVCAAYAPKGITIKTIPELRWHLFTKHMAESDNRGFEATHPESPHPGTGVGTGSHPWRMGYPD